MIDVLSSNYFKIQLKFKHNFLLKNYVKIKNYPSNRRTTNSGRGPMTNEHDDGYPATDIQPLR